LTDATSAALDCTTALLGPGLLAEDLPDRLPAIFRRLARLAAERVRACTQPHARHPTTP